MITSETTVWVSLIKIHPISLVTYSEVANSKAEGLSSRGGGILS